MKLSELVGQQAEWESSRGIDNGRFNIPRIQVELDEAAAETDAFEALGELIDVAIILAGGMARAAEEAGIEYNEIDRLLVAKLMTNHVKYHMHFFSGADPKEAQWRAREWWETGKPWEGNDYY